MKLTGYNFPSDLESLLDDHKPPITFYDEFARVKNAKEVQSIYWPYPLMFTFEDDFSKHEVVFTKDSSSDLSQFFKNTEYNTFKGVIVIPPKQIELVPKLWRDKVKTYYFRDQREPRQVNLEIKDDFVSVRDSKDLSKFDLIDKTDYSLVGASSILFLAIMKLGYFDNSTHVNSSVFKEIQLTPFHKLIICGLE